MQVTVISNKNMGPNAQPLPGKDLALPFDPATMRAEPPVPKEMHRSIELTDDDFRNPAYAHVYELAFMLAKSDYDRDDSVNLAARSFEYTRKLIKKERANASVGSLFSAAYREWKLTMANSSLPSDELLNSYYQVVQNLMRQRSQETQESDVTYSDFQRKVAADPVDALLSGGYSQSSQAVRHAPVALAASQATPVPVDSLDFGQLMRPEARAESGYLLNIPGVGHRPMPVQFAAVIEFPTVPNSMPGKFGCVAVLEPDENQKSRFLTLVLDRRIPGIVTPWELLRQATEVAVLRYARVVDNQIDSRTVRMHDVAGYLVIQELGDLTLINAFLLDR